MKPTTFCSSCGWIHRGGQLGAADASAIDKAVRSILARQLPDGGFNIYVDGPAEISASVKAYFALKLAGVAADGESMLRLRERILELGGIQAANSYVKDQPEPVRSLSAAVYCPSIPPEVVLLPGKFLYQMSAWSRDIVLPLAIVHASNPRKPVPAGFDLDETVGSGREPAIPQRQVADLVAQLFPGDRPAVEVVGAARAESGAAAGRWRRRGSG